MHLFSFNKKQPTKSLVLAIGNYDGLHLGHQAILSSAKELAEKTNCHSALLIFEPAPSSFFLKEDASARLMTVREKYEWLRSCGIDYLYVQFFSNDFSNLSPAAFIERLANKMRASTLIVGADFRFGKNRTGDFAFLERESAKQNMTVIAAPTQTLENKRISSSWVRSLLAEGDLKKAGELLGRPYSMTGKVIHGEARGRAWGFPTANILRAHRQVPFTGVFVVEVQIGKEAKLNKGVANLGYRPTIGGALTPRLEVHLLDFQGDLYGRRLQIYFLNQLRPEQKFSSIDALRAQIAEDARKAREWFEG